MGGWRGRLGPRSARDLIKKQSGRQAFHSILLQEAAPGDYKGQQDGPLHVGRQRLLGRQGAPRARAGVRGRGSHHDTALSEPPRRSVGVFFPALIGRGGTFGAVSPMEIMRGGSVATPIGHSGIWLYRARDAERMELIQKSLIDSAARLQPAWIFRVLNGDARALSGGAPIGRYEFLLCLICSRSGGFVDPGDAGRVGEDLGTFTGPLRGELCNGSIVLK